VARERKGFIFEREPGTWYARVTLQDQFVKRRDLWRKADNKTHAKDLLKQLLRDLDDSGGTIVEGNKTNLDDYLNRWLKAAAKPRLRMRSYSDYEDMLRLYIRPILGRKRLCDVRPLDIQSLYSFLQEEGGGWWASVVFSEGSVTTRKQQRANNESDATDLLKKMEHDIVHSKCTLVESEVCSRPLSPRTVRYAHAILTSALKQAVAWGLIPRNPAQFVELPKQTREEMNACPQKWLAGSSMPRQPTDLAFSFSSPLLLVCARKNILV